MLYPQNSVVHCIPPYYLYSFLEAVLTPWTSSLGLLDCLYDGRVTSTAPSHHYDLGYQYQASTLAWRQIQMVKQAEAFQENSDSNLQSNSVTNFFLKASHRKGNFNTTVLSWSQFYTIKIRIKEKNQSPRKHLQHPLLLLLGLTCSWNIGEYVALGVIHCAWILLSEWMIMAQSSTQHLAGRNITPSAHYLAE